MSKVRLFEVVYGRQCNLDYFLTTYLREEAEQPPRHAAVVTPHLEVDVDRTVLLLRVGRDVLPRACAWLGVGVG